MAAPECSAAGHALALRLDAALEAQPPPWAAAQALCTAQLAGPAAWQAVLQQHAAAAERHGSDAANLAAALWLLAGQPIRSAGALSAAGCAREALAVASSWLLPGDPAVAALRQRHADAAPEEAAAANLLLLEQPAAAATALARRDGSATALHAAAGVAALGAAHAAGEEQAQLASLAAACSLQALLVPSDAAASQLEDMLSGALQQLAPLAGSSAAAQAAWLVLALAWHLLAAAQQAADQAAPPGAAAPAGAAASLDEAADRCHPGALPSQQQLDAAVAYLWQRAQAQEPPSAAQQLCQQLELLLGQLPALVLQQRAGDGALLLPSGTPPPQPPPLQHSMQHAPPQGAPGAVACCVAAALHCWLCRLHTPGAAAATAGSNSGSWERCRTLLQLARQQLPLTAPQAPSNPRAEPSPEPPPALQQQQVQVQAQQQQTQAQAQQQQAVPPGQRRRYPLAALVRLAASPLAQAPAEQVQAQLLAARAPVHEGPADAAAGTAAREAVGRGGYRRTTSQRSSRRGAFAGGGRWSPAQRQAAGAASRPAQQQAWRAGLQMAAATGWPGPPPPPPPPRQAGSPATAAAAAASAAPPPPPPPPPHVLQPATAGES